MKNKVIIAIAIVIILIAGISAYVLSSNDTSDPVTPINNNSSIVINKSIDVNNSTNNKTTALNASLEIKDDPNFPTTKKIGKEDTIYIFYNSGDNGQEDIRNGLIISILNGSDELEGKTIYKISQVIVKFEDEDNKTTYKTYSPNEGNRIKVSLSEDLTPISAVIFYKLK